MIPNNFPSKNKELSTFLKSDKHAEDIIKICNEYRDRLDPSFGDNSSSTLSPIVKNLIKTNGSLPRDKNLHFIRNC